MKSSGWMGQACGQPSMVCISGCMEMRLHQAGLRWHLVCFEGADSEFWNRLWAIGADAGRGNRWYICQMLLPFSFWLPRVLRDWAVWTLGWDPFLLFCLLFFFSFGICRKQGRLPKHQFRKASGVNFQVLVPPWLYLMDGLISAGRSYTASTLLPCIIAVHG